MRLVDADVLQYEEEYDSNMRLVIPATKLERAPTVDAELVVHAHWEYDPHANDWGIGGWCCSKCHFKNDILGASEKLPFPIKMFAGVRYCAQCGAKMDEEVEV